MAADGEEIRPRNVTHNNAVRKYHIWDAADEGDVADFIATLPATVAGYPFSGFEANEIEESEGADEYFATVTWGQLDGGGSETQPAGTSNYRFSYQAPSGKIKRSLVTIASYADADFFPVGPPDFGGAINVTNYSTPDQETEGVDLQAPPEVFVLTYTDVDAVIDATYQATVRNLCGKVNSGSFYGANAGEIMLVRADGTRQGGLWNLEFGFAYIPNATSIPITDDLTVSSKDGMDLLWVLEDTAKVSDVIVKQPAAAYVERVWERADLTALNLP